MRRLSYLTAAAVMLSATTCLAAGELHIYNWGDYVSPAMLEKFSKEFDVKVTVDSYDSNETMLSKIRAGGSGYDVAMPSDYTVKIMVDEGMLAKAEPASMPNFKNLRPDMVDVYWDEGRHYSIPRLPSTRRSIRATSTPTPFSSTRRRSCRAASTCSTT